MDDYSRRLLVVHAHPDDEALTTGGTIARYASEGAHVCLVTCTNGELGEIAEVDGMIASDIASRLGEVRTDELREACRFLGVTDLRLLGYHDSGMAGTDGNDDPKAFVNVDLDRVTRDLVEVVRDVRPQVAVTYNDFGFYGHPDHIQAHRATVSALEAATDPGYAPELGPPHTVDRLFYTAVPKSDFRAIRDRMKERAGPEASEEDFSDEQIERIGTDESDIAVIIDVNDFTDAKFNALRAHRTQLGTIAPFLELVDESRGEMFGTEYFALAHPDVRPDGVLNDLFEGIGP